LKAPTSFPNPMLRGARLRPGVQRPGLWYRTLHRMAQVLFISAWRVRVFDRRFEPAGGGVLYICNHQSFLDPALMSLALRRPMNFMARDSLFRFEPFGALIRSLNAFPVKRSSADTGALKEAMRRLKAGGQLVVFPEGTRTLDGRIGPFLPGVAMLAQRAADWTVPVVIDGAFECWPRSRKIPRGGSIVVRYARPIHRSQAARLAPEDFLASVRQAMIELQSDMRRRLGRPSRV
jgi:1-acyl-sn-glycerol-3-phosphate acyltransferase